ncbi:2-phosphoxylose phosphatase 1 isoform X2 [Cherax quadricarinatus]|uniref:2-phosphoxylose phosphatase 1 isoform X2 n=1 Tax=Cherax quadricarinatus TaxID=27406 RepID=UPI002378B0B2|nr:2-phosphoxylose phosphatase 1-like isoform X2 [Cherax quadricarinatus]
MRWHKKFKVLRCYILILGWLGIILLFLSYWRVETDVAHPPPPPLQVNSGSQPVLSSVQHEKPRSKKLRHQCNPADRIQRHQEGVLPSQYELSGVMIVLRHGDRGPLLNGVLQHLQLGKILKEIYFYEFNLLGNKQQLDDIIVYSTKYRRTFQSVLAFLYSFIPKFDISKIRLREGKGVSFCENDCHCEKTDYFDQKYDQERKDYRKSHPGVIELVRRINPLIKAKASAEDIINPLVMRDALLSYVCHGAALPCNNERCVKVEDVTSLISYEEWEGKQKRTSAQRRAAKLKSYGLLKNIVATIDRMIGDAKPRVVIYSGHDKTLKYLLDSLAIPNYPVPYYASRLILELYRNSSVTHNSSHRMNFFFRFVYNGKDITKSIPFCDSITIKQLKSGSVKRGTISMCSVSKLESYIRPEQYFKEFSAVSFREACRK